MKVLLILLLSLSIFSIDTNAQLSINVFGSLNKNLYQEKRINPFINNMRSSQNIGYGLGTAYSFGQFGVVANLLINKTKHQFELEEGTILDFPLSATSFEVLGSYSSSSSDRLIATFYSGIRLSFADYFKGYDLSGEYSSGPQGYTIIGYSRELNQELVGIVNMISLSYSIDLLSFEFSICTHLGIQIFHETFFELNNIDSNGSISVSDEVLFTDSGDQIEFRIGTRYKF